MKTSIIVSGVLLEAACCSLLVVGLCGQIRRSTGPPSERYMELEGNTAKLKVAITLDRSEYLPGEVAEVTISVVNPTTGSIEAFEPFRGRTGILHVALQPGTEQKTIYRAGDDELLGSRKETDPTRWFYPGETMTRTLDSFEGHFDNQTTRLFAVPNDPGEFQLVYTYHYRTVPAKFRVLPAVLVVPTFVPLQKAGQYQSEANKTVTYQRNVALLVVQVGAKYHIIASRNATHIRFIERASDGSFMEAVRSFTPIVRVFESDQPIVSLSGIELSPGSASTAGTPIAPESIRVNWTTADGKQSTATLGPNRKPIQ